MPLRKSGIATLCLLLIGCGSMETARINGDSDDAFHASLTAMERTLTRQEHVELQGAILRIRLTGAGSAEDARSMTGGKQIRAIDIKDQIDGLSFVEIIELADRSGVEVDVLE